MAKQIKLKIDELMARHNLTQTQLSDLADVRQAAISQLSRNDASRISIGQLGRIATALDIDDMNELMTIVNVDQNADK